MVLEMSLGAPKVGQRSSSLSRTVQINRNRSRPGSGHIKKGTKIHDKTDLGQFLIDFGMLFGLILNGFSMNSGTKFHEFWDLFWTKIQ